MSSVLLISMPMAEPTLPNLGMEVLAQVLRVSGQTCDVLYGSLLMPRRVGRGLTHAIGGQAVFVPAHFGLDATSVAETMASTSLARTITPTTFDERVTEILIGMDAAEECLEACLAAIPPKRYDVIAFSVIFDGQKLPSIALASRLKVRDEVAILFGGSACDGGMGAALMEVFDA